MSGLNDTEVRDSWPYLDAASASESKRHVQLKNLAVYWLLNRGFTTDDIHQEVSVPVDGSPSRSKADIYARQDGAEVFVECETSWHTMADLSNGGKVPAKNGKAVFVFKADGIHRVVEKTVISPGGRSGQDREREVLDLERVRQLPMLDFSAF